uniref:Protein yellow n=1 Tax=Cacopsylla melanoneura TaxID=428564 RepID=A0A8D8Q8T8_9HEMI
MVPYSLLIPLLLCLLVAILVESRFSVPYEWKSVDFTWPSSRTRDQAIQNGRYDPTKIAILDVDVYDPANYGHNGPKRVFVTTPKFQPGVPITLSTLSSKQAQDGSPLLEPFPSWSSQNEKDCEGIISVYRTQIDECGRLWVLDTGKLDTFTATPRKLCSPQIVVYDLHRGDKVILRYRFPDSQLEENSLLITIAVDTRNAQCSKQFAYIADVNGYKMLVYDVDRRESWPVTSNYFYPDPKYGFFDLNGAQFDLMDGLFGIALGPLQNNVRRVHFHSLASVKEAWTFSSILLNQTLFENNNTPTKLFSLSDFDRSSQSSSEVMSDEGILFFPLLKSNSLACWNSKTVYRQENFETIYKNDQTFQFVSGMKLVNNKDLYVLTSRLQNYIATGVSDTTQVNYRILSAKISDLTRKTSCDVARFDFTGYLTQDAFVGSNLQHNNVNKYPPGSSTSSGYFNAQGSKFTSFYGHNKKQSSAVDNGNRVNTGNSVNHFSNSNKEAIVFPN